VDTDLYIVRYFLCFDADIPEGVMCGNSGIVINGMCSHAGVIDRLLAFTFRLSVTGVFISLP